MILNVNDKTYKLRVLSEYLCSSDRYTILDSDKNHVTYSTCYSEGNTGLIYYTYRHYAPRLHKWINKDPIAESGGLNLYQMVGNDTIGNWDNLGNIHVVGMAEKCSIDINVGHGSLHNGLPLSKDPKMGDANAANKICAQDAKRRKFTPCNYRVTAVSCYDAIANSKGNIGSYGLDNPNDVHHIRLVQYLKEALDETISEAESTAKKSMCGQYPVCCSSINIYVNLLEPEDPSSPLFGYFFEGRYEVEDPMIVFYRKYAEEYKTGAVFKKVECPEK